MDLHRKKLYRSVTDKRLVGVCSGLGSFFELDPVLIRLAWVFGTAVTGVVPGLLAYAVAWLIVPEEPRPVYEARPMENAPENNA